MNVKVNSYIAVTLGCAVICCSLLYPENIPHIPETHYVTNNHDNSGSIMYGTPAPNSVRT